MLRVFAALLISLSLSTASEAANKPKAQPKPGKRAPASTGTRKAPKRMVAQAPAAKPASKPKVDTSYKVRAPAASAYLVGSGHESDKAIQITGQARNLSMMLTLRNEKDRIKFVEVRRHFRPEIAQTNF